MGLIARKGFKMYDLEFWLWTIVPIVNTSFFIAVLFNLILRNWRLDRRGKIILAFTGTSFFSAFVNLVTTWLGLTDEPGYVLNPTGPFTIYTEATVWVAGIGLLALGFVKLYELLMTGGKAKTEEPTDGEEE